MTKTENKLKLFVRFGDGGDYEELGAGFGGLANLVIRLHEFKVTKIEMKNRYGVTCEGFQGNNYISLYWSRQANVIGQSVRGITDEEIAYVNESLNVSEAVSELLDPIYSKLVDSGGVPFKMADVTPPKQQLVEFYCYATIGVVDPYLVFLGDVQQT